MVLVQASKLNLPSPCKSLLFEPTSLSLALLHSDTSLSLFPSLPSPPLSSLPQMLSIPSPSSSHSFLLLQDDHLLHRPRVLFIVAGPHNAGSSILLRFYLLRSDDGKVFDRAKVLCKQKGLHFDNKFGVLLETHHGLKIKIVGSTNFFALYSVSSSKIWIFGARLVDVDGTEVVKLMRCAVIDCCRPVFSLSLSFEFLVLGEENGVRVLNLRALVKGKARKMKSSGSNVKTMQPPNGVVPADCYVSGGFTSEIACSCYFDGKNKKLCATARDGTVKYILECGKGGSFFVGFNEYDAKDVNSGRFPMMSSKAVSIQPLSQKNFLILSSAGDLSVLHVSRTIARSSISCHMRNVPYKQKVQELAILPDISSKTQCVWISDGNHSVHVMDIDAAVTETDNSIETEAPQMQISVSQAIFAGEKIQDMAAISARSILILGHGKFWHFPSIEEELLAMDETY